MNSSLLLFILFYVNNEKRYVECIFSFINFMSNSLIQQSVFNIDILTGYLSKFVKWEFNST